MCDAGITEGLVVAGLVTSVAGAATSAYSSYQQAEASNAAANYNAQVAKYQAQQATDLGDVEAKQHDMQVKQLLGQQVAAYSGAGVDPDSGSALTTQTQTAGYGALDSLAIKQQAASQAWGYNNAATLDLAKQVDPFGAGAASLLQSSSSIGSSALKVNQQFNPTAPGYGGG